MTIGLVRERHELPNTRDIAKAAGIAEGTMFRAFETKDALTDAVVGAIACPVPLRTAIGGIDPTLPLRERTLAATQLLMERFAGLLEVLQPLGVNGPPAHHRHPGCPDPEAKIPSAHPGERTALESLFACDADHLRLGPEEFAHVLRLLAFGNASRQIGRAQLLSAAEVTDLLLDGAARREQEITPPVTTSAPTSATPSATPSATKECPC